MPEETAVWAIVELMGHVRLAGRLTEEEKFGAKMGRLDIPMLGDVCRQCDGKGCWHGMGDDQRVQPCLRCKETGLIDAFVTQFFGGGSVYRITIVGEEVARHVCRQTSPAPVSPWDFPKRITAKAVVDDGPNIDPDDDDDD